MKKIENILFLEDEATLKKLLLGGWTIAVIVFFEVIVTDIPLKSSFSPWKTYIVIFYLLIYIVSSKQSVGQMKNRVNSFIVVVYFVNIVMVVIELLFYERSGAIDFELGILVRECSISFFWLLSIPLTAIRNVKTLFLAEVIIYLSSCTHFVLLKKFAFFAGANSNIYTLVAVGSVFIVFIISVYFYRSQLKLIFS